MSAPVRAPASDVLADPTRLCGSIVLAAVEVLSGARPLVQLSRWLTPELFETLAAATVPGRPHVREAAPVGRGPTGPVSRPTVRRVHLSRVSATAAEASVVVHDGSRVRAAAVRLQVHRAHWRATVLEIG